MKHWPLRAKITAWSALVSGGALLLFGIFGILFIYSEQVEPLDAQLREEAQAFFRDVRHRKDPVRWESRKRVQETLPLTRSRRLMEVTDAAGKSLYRTKDPKGESLPKLPPGAHTITAGGQAMRLGVFPDGPLTLYLASPLQEIYDDTKRTTLVALVCLPLLAALIAAGAWCVAGRALRPVHELTVATQQITTEHLGRRLPAGTVRDEIGRLTEVLNAMFDRLDVGFRQAARFSADASHELKSPVAVLRVGLEDLLQSSTLPSADAAVVSSLLEETHRLSAIIDSLLLLSRVDAGRLELDLVPGDVGAVIEGCVEDARIAAEDRGITIEYRAPEPLVAAIDEQRLMQIAANLLQNAVRYNRDGGVVRVEACRRGDRVEIAVANTGAGIAPADGPKLFDRFFRGSQYPGTTGQGLGLSLARELARAHGGDVDFVSSDGDWTVFRLSLGAEHGVAGC